MSFTAELKRRNVIRVGIAYIIVGWVLAQIAEFAFENFGAPAWVLKSVVVVLLLGLPLALGWFSFDKFYANTGSQPLPEPNVLEKSVAVLPFVALSNGTDDEYFADGLTEEILNSLAQLPELLVTARTSAFSFKGQNIPIQEIAAALGVNHIVEGSYDDRAND